MKNIIKRYHDRYIDLNKMKVVDAIKQLQQIIEETNDSVAMEIEQDECEFYFHREETDKEYADRLEREANFAENTKQNELRQLRALKEKYGDIE